MLYSFAERRESVQVEIFGPGSSYEVQRKVNKWLEENSDKEIVDKVQSGFGYYSPARGNLGTHVEVVISIWYVN